jgi:hypothetical protein
VIGKYFNTVTYSPTASQRVGKQVPRRQILGKESVARLRNNRVSCVFRVRDDVTTVDSGHVTCLLQVHVRSLAIKAKELQAKRQ